MGEYWVKLKPTGHARKKSKERRVSIPKQINMLDPRNLIIGPWDERGDPKVIIFTPMEKIGDQEYYKRIPAVIKGGNFQELDVLSIMIREKPRIGNAKKFQDWLRDLKKAGLI